MEKFTAFIEKHIAPMANKLGRNKYVVALQNSFFAMIPFITVGALALVLISPPADYTSRDGRHLLILPALPLTLSTW